MLVAKKSERGGEKPVGAMSDEAVRDVADDTMELLRAQLGRAPTLAEVQQAMVEIAAIVWRKFHAEEGAMISETPPSVEAPHDDSDASGEVRTPTPRLGRRC